MRELVVRESGKEVYDFISKHIDVTNPDTLIVATTTAFNIESSFNLLSRQLSTFAGLMISVESINSLK